MNFEKLLGEIEKHKWWNEEGPGVVQMIAYPLHCFITQSKVFHQKLLSISLLLFRGSYFYERTPEDEKYLVYQHIFMSMKENRDYLKPIIKDTRKKAKILFEAYKNFVKNRNLMNNEELCASYTDSMDKYVDYMAYPAGIECIDILTNYYLGGFFKNELPELSGDELREIIIVLTSPKKLSFIEKERLEFLRFCLENYDEIKNNNLNENIKKQSKSLSKKYFYVLNNFKDVRFLDQKYFLEKAKEETRKEKTFLQKEFDSLKSKVSSLKDKKRELYKKYKLSSDLKLHLKITEIFGESIDERKNNMLKANHYIELYCKEITKRSGLDVWEVKNYTFEEVRELLLHNKRVDKAFLLERSAIFVHVMKNDGSGGISTEWFHGKEAETIMQKTSQELSDEIKGQVASAPAKKITGKVQVILDVSKKEFEEGNILVTSMTRPEFVPLMRKAKAIITDEGGITCHAAIISRELKIPCIIGTKTATKVLKDGNLVEIHGSTGVVKILKK
jgi:phosphohistidine swiveling domain-containing protein